MPQKKTPKQQESEASKARFFFQHGRVDWAIEALENATGADGPELAAACVDAAASCDAFFTRESAFDRWIDAAMALPPKGWQRHRAPWARALAALSAKEDPLGAAFVEDLLASAPASIHSMDMSGGAETVRDWLASNMSNRHGDWVQALDALAAIKHDPSSALKTLAEPPYAMSSALSGLCHALYVEMKDSDYGCGRSDDILRSASDEDRPALALSIMHSICCRVRDLGPDDDDQHGECEDFMDLCLYESLRATPALARASASHWCEALSVLAQIDSELARTGFEDMAARVEPQMLEASRYGQKTSWRDHFSLERGKLGDLVHRADALAQKAALEARDDAESPLKAILATARAAAPRKPRL